MAVPSSGELSLRGIRQEIYNNNYNGSNSFSNVGLTSLSTGLYGAINTVNIAANRPDGSTPHQMSEFYSYDHDAQLLTSFSGIFSTTQQICGNTPNITYYHDGNNANPVLSDTIYEDSAGSTVVGAGNMATSTLGGLTTNSSGVVNGQYFCGKR